MSGELLETGSATVVRRDHADADYTIMTTRLMASTRFSSSRTPGSASRATACLLAARMIVSAAVRVGSSRCLIRTRLCSGC